MRNGMRRVLALVVGWACLLLLLGQALAEPLVLQGRQSSGVGRIAALPRQGNTPTLPPISTLPPKAHAKAPTNVTTLGRLPLAFIENQGQVDEQAKFYVRTGGQTLWLTQEGLIFDLLKTKTKGGADPVKLNTARELLSKSPPPLGERINPHTLPSSPPGERIKVRGERDEGRGQTERLVFAQDFVGANKNPKIEVKDPQPGIYNYFLGNDPAKWRTGVKAYADVIYREVWKGIDLKLSGHRRDLEQEPSRLLMAAGSSTLSALQRVGGGFEPTARPPR